MDEEEHDQRLASATPAADEAAGVESGDPPGEVTDTAGSSAAPDAAPDDDAAGESKGAAEAATSVVEADDRELGSPASDSAPPEDRTSADDRPSSDDPASPVGEAAPVGELPHGDSAPQDDPTSQAHPALDPADASADDADAPVSPTVEPPPPVLVRRSVSQEIARRLYAAGARFCFTVPGESFLPLIDDLSAAGIRVVTARHESGAAFMAEALAQSTGRAQVVMVTRGVGAANASIGIHTARQDSAPLVILVGQVERSFLGREAFQETDLVQGAGSLAMWAAQIDEPASAVATLDKAWQRLHTGRPGPVLLSVPEDVQSEEIEVVDGPDEHPPGARGPAADRAAVRRVMKMLAASERGVIVAGGGVLQSRSTKRLVALSEALAVPVVAAWRRPDVFPNDHANYLGMAGYSAPATVKQRLLDADAILFVGTRMSEVTTFGYAVPAPGTEWAHVDLVPRRAHAGLSAPSVSVAADASRFLDSAWSDLRAAALDAEMRGRREARNAADREAFRAARTVGQGEWSGPGIHPGRMIDTLRMVLPDNATLTTDAGNFAGWAARGFAFRRAGTFLGPTSGAMGFGLPAAIAASLQDPDRIAVAICGDGGMAMTMMELETAVREGAHPIAIVMDNQRFGTIAMHQARTGRPTDSSDLGPIDFAAMARAYGALGFSVAEDAAFEPALREAIASRQPSVIHVALDRAWVSVDDDPLASEG